MADTEETRSRGETLGLERVRYFPRQLLTADDMRAEQEHARQRQRRFNRFVIGWGVVCGLEVERDPDTPAVVLVHPGYALSPCGDEIYVPEVVPVELERRLAGPADPCKPTTAAGGATAPLTAKTVYIVIRYHECPTRPVRTSPAGCGCDETACEYSRLRDGYQIELLGRLPSSHDRVAEAKLCARVGTKVIPSPPFPKDSWVVLATLIFETRPGEPPTAGTPFGLHYKDRRILVSPARAQLLELCSE